MRNAIFSMLIISFLLSACTTRQQDPRLNLGFEKTENGFAAGWENFGSFGSAYSVYLDSTTVKKGKYAAVIEYNEESAENFKALSFFLPENYQGEQITLSGYIKTENVTDGFAGLWMQIHPGIASDNMHDRGVTGTTDWTKYEVTLCMQPSRTTQIAVGGMLIGKGKMWLDHLTVTIDGKKIEKAVPYVKEILPAETDKEFDEASLITFPHLNEPLISNLELLGKVWGFLKYHHPAPGKGLVNWDYELFRMLPDYLQAKNMKERDQYLLDWINTYDAHLSISDLSESSGEVLLTPDHSWMEQNDITSGLRNKLKDIYVNRHQGDHFYIKLQPYVGNPDFQNENSYQYMTLPDEGFRLLALYRYWNMIHYFFPNTYMTDKNWQVVLKEYIPLFISANGRMEYELAALRLIGEINDTHAVLWGRKEHLNELRGPMFPPFRVEFVENKLVVTDYYNPEYKGTAQLEIGDVITHIGGKTIQSLVDSLKPYYPASNEAAMLRDIAQDLLRSRNLEIDIRYLSSGQSKQKKLSLYNAVKIRMYNGYKINKYVKCYKLLDDNIGYVTLANIKEEDINPIKETFENTQGMIIDIRNYPSVFVPFTLAPFFVSQPSPFVRFTNGNPDHPGEFIFTSPIEIPSENKTYQGKLVVLVNEITQSAAEYAAMAFRAGDNTTIIGSTTAGADGNVSSIALPGGLNTMISGIGVYYPDGSPTQRVGIIPDITIKPTIKGIKEGRDEVLEKAKEIIVGN